MRGTAQANLSWFLRVLLKSFVEALSVGNALESETDGAVAAHCFVHADEEGDCVISSSGTVNGCFALIADIRVKGKTVHDGIVNTCTYDESSTMKVGSILVSDSYRYTRPEAETLKPSIIW